MSFSLPAELVIVGVILIAILSLFIIGIEYLLPTFDRAKFDDINSKYLTLLNKNGGLTEEDKINLENELISLGFSNIRITAPESVSWGEEATLKVVADYQFEVTKIDGSKEIRTKTATYENSIIVLSLGN